MVSQSLRFISTAIRSGYYKELFSSRDTISLLVQGVVIPNVALREHEIEQFEDDPLEYIRLDLSLSVTGADLATRRQAAADVLQALVSSGYEAEATEIVGSWINKGLSEYSSNKTANWKAKDSAVYLLTAVATRGSTTQVKFYPNKMFWFKKTHFGYFSTESHQPMLWLMLSSFSLTTSLKTFRPHRGQCILSCKSMLFGSCILSETRYYFQSHLFKKNSMHLTNVL